MPICELDGCDIEFEDLNKGGNPRRFCCEKHRKIMGRIRANIRKSTEDMKAHKPKAKGVEARQNASLHCAKYNTCDNWSNCYRCTKMEYLENAYQKEIRTDMFNLCVDEFPLNI